ncbi:MAG: hypothetical protein QUT30_12695 [Acidobacteriota bacterium]|jgi:hypothetical protein|nr:hypothetical protein [Acidobacteriota bacterium]
MLASLDNTLLSLIEAPVALSKSIGSTFAFALLILLVAAACGTHPAGVAETEKALALPGRPREVKEPQSAPVPVRRVESAGSRIQPTKGPSPDPLMVETPKNQDSGTINWGREATLDEIMAMAKNGEIQQIEWHVMPNVIRAQAADGRIFHIRNENKAIDMRNTLISAGINLGRDGIVFRHVF